MVDRRRLRPLLLAASIALTAAGQSRWVVDVVQVGDAKSERDHDYAAEGVSGGMVEGKTFRQARGWLRYSMRVFDDTEVAVACVFRGSEGRRLVFDLVVDSRKVATHTFVSPSTTPVTVEYRVPLKLTEGKPRISVMLRGVDGPTPGLIELRTVQEHLEQPDQGRGPTATAPAGR
jgi:hypothetical protein